MSRIMFCVVVAINVVSMSSIMLALFCVVVAIGVVSISSIMLTLFCVVVAIGVVSISSPMLVSAGIEKYKKSLRSKPKIIKRSSMQVEMLRRTGKMWGGLGCRVEIVGPGMICVYQLHSYF